MYEINPADKGIAVCQIGRHWIFIQHFAEFFADFGGGDEKGHVLDEVVIFAFHRIIRMCRICHRHGHEEKPIVRSPRIRMHYMIKRI